MAYFDDDGFELFGRINSEGNVDVLTADSGEWATRLRDDTNGVYPVGSELSTSHEHAAGITITREDADRIGLQVGEY